MKDINFAVFIATSIDGFIARANGKLDWLNEAAPKGDTEDYGFQQFMQSVDCLVMGRKSFEKIASFSEWPYQGKRVIVLSKSMQKVADAFVDKIELFNGQIELLAVELQHQGVRKVYVDGGLTIQAFLRADLLDEMIITQIPILIGRGIPLFGDLRKDVHLALTSSQSYPSGFVQSRFKFLRGKQAKP